MVPYRIFMYFFFFSLKFKCFSALQKVTAFPSLKFSQSTLLIQIMYFVLHVARTDKFIPNTPPHTYNMGPPYGSVAQQSRIHRPTSPAIFVVVCVRTTYTENNIQVCVSFSAVHCAQICANLCLEIWHQRWGGRNSFSYGVGGEVM